MKLIRLLNGSTRPDPFYSSTRLPIGIQGIWLCGKSGKVEPK